MPGVSGKGLKRQNRIQTVAQKLHDYQRHYAKTKRAQSVLSNQSRLAHVQRLLGAAMLGDLTEDAISAYIEERLEEGSPDGR